MCIGIPLQVVRCEGHSALCQGRGAERWIDLSLVGAQAPGTWLLTFLGTAREAIGADSAALINAALDGLEAAMAGETDLSKHFADLIDRAPELPSHLRGPLP